MLRTETGIQDHYATLEVTPTASTEVIEAAYRTLMKRYHPDHANGDPGKERHYTEKAKSFNLARDILRDPVARARYDRERMAALSPPPAPATAPVPNVDIGGVADFIADEILRQAGIGKPRTAPTADPTPSWGGSHADVPKVKPTWKTDPGGMVLRFLAWGLGLWAAGWFVLFLLYLGLKAVFQV